MTKTLLETHRSELAVRIAELGARHDEWIKTSNVAELLELVIAARGNVNEHKPDEDGPCLCGQCLFIRECDNYMTRFTVMENKEK